MSSYYIKALLFISVFGFANLLFLSCEFDPPEPIPGYLSVQEVHLKTTKGQGAPTHLIKDLWIILDSVGEHGIYPVGGKIPVIADGKKKLDIFPGIRVNGVKNESIIYEPYKPIFLTHDFTPGKVDTLRLEFSYVDRARFPLIEDFESTVNWRTLDTNALAIQKWSKVPASDTVNGHFEGLLRLSSDSLQNRAELVQGEWLPGVDFINKKVYLEVDVQSAHAQMAFGFQIKDGQQTFKTLNAFILPDSIGNWRKFYFDFTNVLKPNERKYFRVLFFTSLDTDLFQRAEIKMDNLKIVTY